MTKFFDKAEIIMNLSWFDRHIKIPLLGKKCVVMKGGWWITYYRYQGVRYITEMEQLNER